MPMTPHELEMMRKHCLANPETSVALSGWEVTELFEAKDEAERQLKALREHAKRMHSCTGACEEPGL